ncbi:hypothetical protein AVEN_208127-1 [Araneus ventricosus]|uniref:Uncharacterized protein n=1 Tax=Araneus ventricosus TaxID=182803 RepID=A0A4Y2I1M1_ARAVE|nr:hypothetical protein AVEN_208127-1 [Araneus ventricosus]
MKFGLQTFNQNSRSITNFGINWRRSRRSKFISPFLHYTTKDKKDHIVNEHGRSLPSNVSLMVGKRVLQGYVWECRGNGAIDTDTGDKTKVLKSTGIFLISLLGDPDDSM